MKGVFVILDGIGDLPHKKLGNKTPLEYAKTENLDFLANYGEVKKIYPVEKGLIPSSDQGILSLFGNDFKKTSRGWLEAYGLDKKIIKNLKNGDLILRVNFGSIDNLNRENILDRRCGRNLSTNESKTLSEAVNKIKLQSGIKFILKSTVQHRGILILKGKKFSEDISINDPVYNQSKRDKKIVKFKPKNKSKISIDTANILNEFIEKSFDILDNHPINEKRRKKGFFPANYFFMRGAGTKIPHLKKYPNWASFTNMPLEIGFSRLSGMKVFSLKYPDTESSDIYKILWEGLKNICNFSIKNLKRHHKNFSYFYIHIKETDIPGHDDKPFEKKKMIEYLDSTLFKFLKDFSLENKIKILITGDHSTPCKLKRHSSDPVPILIYDSSFKNNSKKRFCEKDAKRDKILNGKDVLKLVGFSN